MTIVLAYGRWSSFSFLSVAKLEHVIYSLEELANSDIKLMMQDRTDLSFQFWLMLNYFIYAQ